jgi:hypothetical protein
MSAKIVGDTVVYSIGLVGIFVVNNNDYSVWGLFFLLIGIFVTGFFAGCMAQYFMEQIKSGKIKWKLIG